jgi:hypothetical protein
MPTTRQYTFDIDTKRYLNRVNTYRLLNGLPNITNGDAVDIDNFIIGLKDLGIWHNIVCWPMRSIQNIGTGSIILSFGGYGPKDGVSQNSPTWSTDGIITTTDNQKIIANISYEGSMSPFGCAVITKRIGSDTVVRQYLVKNSIAVNSRTFFIGTNIQIRWWNFPSTPLNLNIGSFDFCGMSINSTNNGDLQLNNIRTSVTMSNNSPWDSSPRDSEYYTIVRHVGTVASNNYTFPCHIALFGKALPSELMNSIRNLYKATIGKGLGLP